MTFETVCSLGVVGTLFLAGKNNIVLCTGKNVSVCAVHWKKKVKKYLGCAVLYLGVFPCTHRNRGHTIIPIKN